MKNKYNGWKNKATWIVNLYMNNDEGTYSWMNEMISTHLKEYGDIYFAPKDELIWEMADVLKVDISEMLLPIYFESQSGHVPEDVGRTMKEDLLSFALSEVDWFELAKKHVVDWIEAKANSQLVDLIETNVADWIENSETQPTK